MSNLRFMPNLCFADLHPHQLLASLAAKTAGVVALAYVSITVPLPPVLAHLTYAFYVW